MRAIGWQESGFNPAAVSSVGAHGVLQVMPGTWVFTERNYIGHRVPHTADGGIHIGVAYFRGLLRIFHGNERLSIAAYYQGPGAVERYGIFKGSEFYVRNVLWLRRRM
jgi:soluble lytic murein transglycosylase-like protein